MKNKFIIKKKLKQIAIDEKNYLHLKSLGRTGESFNDVLTTILKNKLDKFQSPISKVRGDTS